jgi:NAD(P)H-dependent FMN reductase
MSQILIISATSDLNLDLAKDIQALLSDLGQEANIMELEKLELPLFGSEDQSVAVAAKELTDKMISASAFIFCAPEYNGGVPPILSNAIAWITVQTKNWRDAFNSKWALISTHSAGSGYRFLTAFRSQLEYLGSNVLARTIAVSDEKPLDKDSAKRILQGLMDAIK